MKSITALAFSLVASATFAFGADAPIYDHNRYLETKEALLFSQIIGEDHPLRIKMDISKYGDRGMFAFGENKDPKWEGASGVYIDVSTCVSEENYQKLAKNGTVLQSRFSDPVIAGYRESVDFLKKNGAKYIFVGHSEYNVSESNITSTMPFGDFFQATLKKDIPLNYEAVGRNDEISLNFKRSMKSQCFEKKSSTSLLWGVGQIAALAIGVKGASIGNSSMASLGSNLSHGVDNTVGIMKNNEGGGFDPKYLSAIGTYASFWVYGSVDPQYFNKYIPKDKSWRYAGYLFPIEEVEKHLALYMNVPYSVGKVSKW